MQHRVYTNHSVCRAGTNLNFNILDYFLSDGNHPGESNAGPLESQNQENP